MAAQWVLFYAMVAANLGGGGYALVRGQAVHRWAVAVFTGGVVVQLALCQLASFVGLSRLDTAVTIDMIDNGAMCSGFLAVALFYERANWVIVLMMLQAMQLGLDGFAFQNDRASTQLEFPEAANLINILEMMALGVATSLRRTRMSIFGCHATT